jgi:cytochrome P450
LPSVTSPPVLGVDLTPHDLYRGGFPHQLFRELRDEHPVWRHPRATLTRSPEGIEFWVVLGHPELQALARDWRTFSSLDGASLSPTGDEQRGHTLVSADPPGHTRMRKLISAGFTPRMIRRLDEQIAARTTRILDAAAESGACNFVQDVAYQLPMHVIADIVGIPEDDRPWVFERTDLVLRALDPHNDLTPEDQLGAQVDLFRYASELTERKRREPADDVWTLIAQAEVPGDDGAPTRLEGLELEMFFVILAIAGSETTRNALSQGLMALLDHPDQLADLRADPGLLPTATEEIIRWSSPVLFFGRTATRDVELGGAAIARGDRVILWYPSANRDSLVFDDPFGFDIRRDPNPHVSFGGGGPHFCLGANLARKEVQVLTGAVLDRFDVRLAGAPHWVGAGPVHNVGVSIDHLPIELRPR